jgi:hypothetical protein
VARVQEVLNFYLVTTTVFAQANARCYDKHFRARFVRIHRILHCLRAERCVMGWGKRESTAPILHISAIAVAIPKHTGTCTACEGGF